MLPSMTVHQEQPNCLKPLKLQAQKIYEIPIREYDPAATAPSLSGSSLADHSEEPRLHKGLPVIEAWSSVEGSWFPLKGGAVQT